MTKEVQPSEMLEALIVDRGRAAAVRKEYNAENPDHPMSRSQLSRYRPYSKNPRQMPLRHERWVRDKYLELILDGKVSFLVRAKNTLPLWLEGVLVLIEQQHYEIALSQIEEFEVAGKLSDRTEAPDAPEWSRLAAARGMVSIATGQVGLAARAFEEAVGRARYSALELVNGYHTSWLNARRQLIDDDWRAGELTDDEHWEELQKIIIEQIDVLSEADSTTDKEAAYRHLMRCACLIDDEELFTEYWTQSVTDGFRGKATVELVEERLGWLRADADGDLANAWDFTVIKHLAA
ncbi:MAG: hypothetical protein KDI63_08610 [Gammaproteobacteria bacterium]|nr:hypothetical protein [Gammaproteobacteria bacterium]